MKKQIPAFLSGILVATLVFGLGTATLAATGKLTIEVNPINIQVNGATFAPKDAQGNNVPVFVYNGTTYAPLRALAEAYGLEVGYDAEKKMATVGEKVGTMPDTSATTPTTPNPANSIDYADWTAEEEKAYQEFKGMWDVSAVTDTATKTDSFFVATCNSSTKSFPDIKRILNDIGKERITKFSLRILEEQTHSK